MLLLDFIINTYQILGQWYFHLKIDVFKNHCQKYANQNKLFIYIIDSNIIFQNKLFLYLCLVMLNYISDNFI
jgi:hypothetical protein